jgi:polyphosphate glucokinase
VDIGGTGIKAGRVDSRRGRLIGERERVETPQGKGIDALVDAVEQVVGRLDVDAGPVGLGFPGAIVGGRVMTAFNVDRDWIGVHVADRFSERVGRPCVVLNDADSAGLAEMRFGAGRGVLGVVLTLTLGTGIGSALFVDGVLVPNTEFGHIEIRGKDAERRASAVARERKGLTYEEWAPILSEYLERIDGLVWPDLIILGGGVSKKADRFIPLLEARPPVVAAALRNEAGIVGAALRARELLTPRRTRPPGASARPRGQAASPR